MKEYFDIVDRKDKVIGRATRDECHKKGFLHRAMHIIIINSKGKLLFQKRSMKKDLYPGWWIDAAAGHVGAGEGYKEAAMRELMEEIGIETKIKPIMTFRKRWEGNGKIDNEVLRVYVGRSDGPFNIDKDEVEEIRFLGIGEVAKMIKTEKFTPGSIEIFNRLSKNPSLLRKLGIK